MVLACSANKTSCCRAIEFCLAMCLSCNSNLWSGLATFRASLRSLEGSDRLSSMTLASTILLLAVPLQSMYNSKG